MPSLLFVCTGNTCRSPMAETIFRDLLRCEDELETWTVASAGTWAKEGQPATANARWAMRVRGLDLAGHRAHRVNAEILSAFGLVLVMEDGHRQALQVEVPEVADRVHLLSEAVGERYSISDPNGEPPESYMALADELADLLRRGLPRLREMAA